ncbi:MAG: hypothetical protein JNL82_28645 [Myxococcales bacterium]|nr:hypothetical protein [Myxococcales bacterium]
MKASSSSPAVVPVVASSTPPPTAAGDPSEPEKLGPRFPLAPSASPTEIENHFSDVMEAIPSNLTGTATAGEIWKAIHEGLQAGALPLVGAWIDIVSALHHHGFLSHLPGDRASRAAFLILEKLTPLVRRLHRRRWAIGMER